MNILVEPSKNDWPSVVKRPAFDTKELEEKVSAILADIKASGDAAAKKYTALFDGVELNGLAVTEAEINDAVNSVPVELKEAIILAQKNIQLFHEQQKEIVKIVETMPGIRCWRRSIAIQKVGLYIPGGTAPLFSTLLMLGIPAMIAGCKEIIVCTPADRNGKINPVILFTATLLGLKNIYKIGGVQAIGAMAYGTETVPAVYKIFGPGNQYVTCAKQLVNREGLAIDMPAGPSEVAVYADESAVPAYVAADLLSQAEHGADSQVLLVCSTEKKIREIKEALLLQLETLPRKALAERSLANSKFIVLTNKEDAFALLNEYAPEHLIIASDNALSLSEKVVNAGSVFLGHLTPESMGDYASGTNHTLPTNGYAKAYSGVSLDSFVKKVTFQQLDKTGLQHAGPAVELMAAAEGLMAHKEAVSVRLRNSK